jgi:hypothetical protein
MLSLPLGRALLSTLNAPFGPPVRKKFFEVHAKQTIADIGQSDRKGV